MIHIAEGGDRINPPDRRGRYWSLCGHNSVDLNEFTTIWNKAQVDCTFCLLWCKDKPLAEIPYSGITVLEIEELYERQVVDRNL